jgi:TatA/E family protein of Tat protein translocase
MFGIGFFEILLIMGIASVVIGPQNLPKLARSLGKGWAEFQATFEELKQEVLDEADMLKESINIDQLEQDIVASTKVDIDVNLDLNSQINPIAPDNKAKT